MSEKRLFSIVRELPPLCSHTGPYLYDRPGLGVPLRQHLEQQLTLLPAGGVLAVDWHGITDLTTAVAEELGPRLLQTLLTLRATSRDLYLIHVTVAPAVARSLANMLTRAQLVAPAWTAGPPPTALFLGAPLPPTLRQVLALLYAGHATAAALTAAGVPAASRKLHELYRRYPHLVRRCRQRGAGPRAWTYAYLPPLGGL